MGLGPEISASARDSITPTEVFLAPVTPVEVVLTNRRIVDAQFLPKGVT